MNELSLSCGPVFPAIMKENGRACLFGQATGGAGGFVIQTSYPNPFGVESFTFTGLIARRAYGSLIKMPGVKPYVEINFDRGGFN